MRAPDTGKAPRAKTTTRRSIPGGFEEFSKSLISKYAEGEKAATNLDIIERCLSEKIDLTYLAPYGSTGHGTNVNNYSAVDCFAVIPKTRLFENSGKSSITVCDILKDKFPDCAITQGRPVIVVPFGEAASERHHIVPAFHQSSTEGHDVFAVPAPNDRWVGISPAEHSVWINKLDHTLNQNLKPFIRIVKAWSYFNDTPIWSFYLELCVADFLKKDAGIVYSQDLSNFFRYMLRRNLAPFEATEGCTEPVYGTSIAGKEKAIASLRQAADLSERALTCETRGQIPDAFYLWRKAFNWQFVAY